MNKNLRSILLWSVISAAFIGPGTVTTSARAGSGYGFALLWALLFSILATVVLQETAARLRMAGGKPLGQMIRETAGRRQREIRWGLFAAIWIGCAAYQSGNLLGGYEGFALLHESNPMWWKAAMIGLVALILAMGSVRGIALSLGVLIALMSICYIYLAIRIEPEAAEFVRGAMIPEIPVGAGILVTGLIGTTVVPYNLFLGSGIARGKDIRSMRIGLVTAVLLGGIISICIMVAGTSVPQPLSFEKMFEAFSREGNVAMAWISALGLFAAGLSSGITCPLAAAITADLLLSDERPAFGKNRSGYKLVWGSVVAVGGLFLLLNTKPIPAIILAQAVNGILLPFVVFYILLLANNRNLLPVRHLNKGWYNLLSALLLAVIVYLGMNSLQSAFTKVFPASETGVWLNVVMSALVVGLFGFSLYRLRRGKKVIR